jgi:hypothetical protein
MTNAQAPMTKWIKTERNIIGHWDLVIGHLPHAVGH